jgi:hypothetical protein
MSSIGEQPPCTRIGIALSGGGSRAAAFHRGTLRGLEDVALLASLDVVSGENRKPVASIPASFRTMLLFFEQFTSSRCGENAQT